MSLENEFDALYIDFTYLNKKYKGVAMNAYLINVQTPIRQYRVGFLSKSK